MMQLNLNNSDPDQLIFLLQYPGIFCGLFHVPISYREYLRV